MPLIPLTADECRVLGTLVEKAQTTPGQYPLTLHSLTSGCNQKNNRYPVCNMGEEEVLGALDGLRAKGLVHEAMLSGSRVHKFRHTAREALGVTTAELVVLAELMLRGPQPAGELRGHASRMMPAGDGSLATLEGVVAVLEGLRSRAEPMVLRLDRRPGERAERWAQLLCPDLHSLDAPASAPAAESDLESRVARLEEEVARLREEMRRLGDV